MWNSGVGCSKCKPEVRSSLRVKSGRLGWNSSMEESIGSTETLKSLTVSLRLPLDGPTRCHRRRGGEVCSSRSSGCRFWMRRFKVGVSVLGIDSDDEITVKLEKWKWRYCNRFGQRQEFGFCMDNFNWLPQTNLHQMGRNHKFPKSKALGFKGANFFFFLPKLSGDTALEQEISLRARVWTL